MKKILFTGVLTVICIVFSFTKANAQCAASFTYAVGANGNVTFTCTTIGTSSNAVYSWAFGDGANQSVTGNPVVSHVYPYNYLFQVTLTVNDSLNNQSCFSSITQTIGVNTATCGGSISFTTYEQANGVMWFNDTSNGIAPGTTFTTNFGDGTTANYLGGSHTYAAAGIYTVTVLGAGGQCTYSAVQTITVNYYPCNVNASFAYTVGNNGQVTFQSTSTNTSSLAQYNWNFGDGYTGYGAVVNHTYFGNGSYNVFLTVYDSVMVNCWDSITQTVNLSNCFANVNFVMSKDSAQAPAIVWNAYTNYPQNLVSATWSWGDGSTSTGLTPSHTYSAAGLYNICVTVSVACGSTATACSNTNIYKMNGANSGPITLNVVNTNAVGIKTNELPEVALHILPNPNNGEFEIIFPGNTSVADIEIVDLQGRVVYKEQLDGSKKIKSDTLNNGVYILKVNTGKTTYNTKIVVTK
jgi:PKD repeat protein